MTTTYRHFDQATLDREYSARDTVPDIGPFIREYAERSEEARRTLECRLDVSYGNTPEEVVDIFPAKSVGRKGAPVLIFIHGGYWRMLSQKDSAFMAPCMTGLGIAVVTVNYALAPGVSLDEIVRQCRAAVAWTWRNARSFGGDPDRMVICGSSAGGHLTGMMLSGGWHEDFGIPPDLFRGAVPLSGLFDLEPIRLSNVNEWAKLDVESAHRNSPIHHLPDDGCPLIVSYGDSETSEFKRQSEAFAAAWAGRGWPATCFEHDGRNHFDIVFELCEQKSRLTRAICDMAGIAP